MYTSLEKVSAASEPPMPADADHRTQWDLDAQNWNDTWGKGLNAERAAIGLPPVDDVRSYIFTDRPLLAADPTLAPWPWLVLVPVATVLLVVATTSVPARLATRARVADVLRAE